MKVEHWKHERVREDGAVLDVYGNPNGGVGVTPAVRLSPNEGGCGIDSCTCSEGHWLMISFGRDKESETVSGVTVWFDNWGELALLLSTGEIR